MKKVEPLPWWFSFFFLSFPSHNRLQGLGLHWGSTPQGVLTQNKYKIIKASKQTLQLKRKTKKHPLATTPQTKTQSICHTTSKQSFQTTTPYVKPKTTTNLCHTMLKIKLIP